MGDERRGWHARGRRTTDRAGHGTTAMIMAVVTVCGMAVTGVSSYYVHQAALERRIAEVREQYATKEEVKQSVQQTQQKLDEQGRDLKTTNEKLGNIEKGQAVQEQILRDIRERLDRQPTR